LTAAPVYIAGPLVGEVLLDTVVKLKAEVVVVPTTTEELGIDEAIDEATDEATDEVVDDLVVGVEFGQLIEDSSEDKARQTLSTLNEERMR
jgi:hypothetical protein